MTTHRHATTNIGGVSRAQREEVIECRGRLSSVGAVIERWVRYKVSGWVMKCRGGYRMSREGIKYRGTGKSSSAGTLSGVQ